MLCMEIQNLMAALLAFSNLLANHSFVAPIVYVCKRNVYSIPLYVENMELDLIIVQSQGIPLNFRRNLNF